MKIHKWFWLIGSLWSLSSVAKATEQDAKDEAQRLLESLRKNGFVVEDKNFQGSLPKGKQTARFEVNLYEGNEYYLVAGGCKDAYDIDLEVFDENNHRIGKDDDQDQTALVRIRPFWSGKFFAVVTMHDSTSDGAHWCLLQAYRKE